MNYSLYQQSPKNVTFFINAVIHIFILLIIISTFFFVYVSQLARDKFRSELYDIVNENIGPILQKADKDQYIKKLLQNMRPNLAYAEQYFNVESETTSIENSWLMNATIGIIIGLVLIMISNLIIIRLFYRKIPFGDILRENIIIFILVGVVEVLFFLYIAKKFIPTRPSLVMETVINSLKSSLTT